MMISASATMTASVGWITRRRSSTCDVGDRSCSSACASERGGEQRVAQRRDGAAHADDEHAERQRADDRRAPAAAFQRHADRTVLQPARGQRHRAEQQEGVGEVHRHEQRARQAGVVGDQLEQHQAGADAGFGEHEEHRPAGGAAGRMPGRARSPDGDDQRQQREEGEPARDAVRELDDRRDRRRPRHDLAVAERPVLAAAGAGAGGPHVGPPADHHQVPGDDDPREPGEAVHGVLRIV